MVFILSESNWPDRYGTLDPASLIETRPTNLSRLRGTLGTMSAQLRTSRRGSGAGMAAPQRSEAARGRRRTTSPRCPCQVPPIQGRRRGQQPRGGRRAIARQGQQPRGGRRARAAPHAGCAVRRGGAEHAPLCAAAAASVAIPAGCSEQQLLRPPCRCRCRCRRVGSRPTAWSWRAVPPAVVVQPSGCAYSLLEPPAAAA